jgi:hypothetical protein
MEIVNVKVENLKESKYNPRKFSEKQFEDLKKSIQQFGIIDPIIVNSAKNRKNIVIGGHFRLKVAKALEFKEVPVIYINIPDLKKEKELNLRLNKNLGDWDLKLLNDFDLKFLLDVGFSDEELSLFYEPKIDGKNVEANIEFIDTNSLQQMYSVVIKCTSEEEQKLVMDILKIKKRSIKAEEFLKIWKS